VHRRSVLAVAVIHVPSDFCGGWSSLLCLFVCLGLCFFFPFSFVERGLCWFRVGFWLMFLLPSRPSFYALSQPPLRRRCLVGDVL